MSEERLHIVYTAQDIEKYFAGDLTPIQMHAMEKAALDDPFLAEAMEGYGQYQGQQDWKGTLDSLHESFAKGQAPAKVIPMHSPTRKWWKAIAAIFIIGAGATLTYLLTQQGQNGEKDKPAIAQNIPAVTGGDSIKAPENNSTVNKILSNETRIGPDPAKEKNTNTIPPAATAGGGDLANQPSLANPVTTEKKELDEIKAPAAQGNIVNPNPVARNVYPAPPVQNNQNAVAGNQDAAQNRKAEMAEDSKRDKQSKAQSRAEQEMNHNFIAQVLGPDNTPLPFSNITVRNENLGTYTDVKGNFRLVSSDTTLLVDVRSVGYLPKTYVLHSGQHPNKIVLAEDEIAYKEKTTIKDRQMADNRSSRRARLIKDSVSSVEPADGWDNYGTYIANNIELPDDVLKNDKHGEIGISFDISSSGAITNIKIDPSQCTNCEEQARRLIEKGPQWKNKKGKSTSARVIVQF